MEERELLQRALEEIKTLRNQNRHMATRLDMFDRMMDLLYARIGVNQQGGEWPDVVHELEQALKEEKPAG